MKKTKKERSAQSETAPSAGAEPESAPDPSAAEEAPAGADAAAPEEAVPADPLEALQAERDNLNDRLLRLRADFDNYRRRVLREREEWAQRATEGLIADLLPVLDHFELGFENAQQHEANPAVVEGFRLVFDQALTALGKHGLGPMDALGEVFDPHLHEAITHLPSEDHPPDTVIAQTRRGYLLGDHLLRAPQVVVSSGSQSASPAEEAAPDAAAAGDPD